MGTAAWFSRLAAAGVLSRGIRGALTRPAQCSLNITAAPPGDSPGADVIRATSPLLPPLPTSCHTRLVLLRNPAVAF